MVICSVVAAKVAWNYAIVYFSSAPLLKDSGSTC